MCFSESPVLATVVLSSPQKRSAVDSPSPPPAKKQAMEGLRKSTRAIRPPSVSLAPVAERPIEIGPLTWDTMLERDKKGLVKQNTKLNCQPAAHSRKVERKPIPRPPSPTAASQSKEAIEGRRKRKQYLEKTGIQLGPGESIGFAPKMLTPPKKGVRWGAPLEAGYSSDLDTHSPSTAKNVNAEGIAKIEAVSSALPQMNLTCEN